MKNRPIGIMDSGLGGLTVAREIKKMLPKESIMYVGDSINTPYGDKSDREIYQLSKKLVRFLLKKKVKLIVIACNTITVTCIDLLRTDFPQVPIIGVVPVIKKAAEVSLNKKIGILSTVKTARSRTQKVLIDTFASDYDVINKGTNKIVPLVENGLRDDGKITCILNQVLAKFTSSDIDTLVLGCTHYAFVSEEIQQIVGKHVRILDSGYALSKQVDSILHKYKSIAENDSPAYQFNTTGSEYTMQSFVSHVGFSTNTLIKTISL